MKTQIKKYGDSKIIVLSADFLKFHNAVVGDWIDLSDVIVIPNKVIQKEEDNGKEESD